MSDFSPEIEKIITLAFVEARQQRSAVVGTPHTFIAMTKVDGSTAAWLRGQGFDPKLVRDALRTVLGQGDSRLRAQSRRSRPA